MQFCLAWKLTYNNVDLKACNTLDYSDRNPDEASDYWKSEYKGFESNKTPNNPICPTNIHRLQTAYSTLKILRLLCRKNSFSSSKTVAFSDCHTPGDFINVDGLNRHKPQNLKKYIWKHWYQNHAPLTFVFLFLSSYGH